MKATLEFNLPEENHDFQNATRAGLLRRELDHMDRVARANLKHGVRLKDYETPEGVFEWVRECVREALEGMEE